MNKLYRVAAISSCFAASGVFGLAASVRHYEATPQTLSRTVQQIQQAITTGTRPDIVLGELRSHPFSPLFFLLSGVSGTSGAILALAWLWNFNPTQKPEKQPLVEKQYPFAVPSAPVPVAEQQNNAPAFPSLSSQPTVLQTAQATQIQAEIQGVPSIAELLQIPFEQRRKWLWDLFESQLPWFLQLLESTPILIYGEQRSGKSQPALALLAIRKLFLGHEWEICNPHGHLEKWPEIGKFIPVYGGQHNYREINSRIVAYNQRLQSKDASHSVLWDEFTRYKGNCNSEELLKSFLGESAKTNQFPIIVSHGNTQELLGGTKGTCGLIQQGCVQLFVFGKKNSIGKTVPSGKGVLTGIEKDSKGEPISIEVDIPKWLQGDWILSIFPEICQPIQAQEVSHSVTTHQLIEELQDESEISFDANSIHDSLERLWEIDAAVHGHEVIEQDSPDNWELSIYPSDIGAVLRYIKTKGGRLSVRQIQQAKLRELERHSADDIRSIMTRIEAQSLGTVERKSADWVLVVG